MIYQQNKGKIVYQLIIYIYIYVRILYSLYQNMIKKRRSIASNFSATRRDIFDVIIIYSNNQIENNN